MVTLRPYLYLLIWVTDSIFPSTNRTTARLIVVALNGSIQGGTGTELQGITYISTASSVACDIDIEFVDDTLIIRNSPATKPVARVSSVSKISAHRGYNGTTVQAG
jgi:hypothetical protein